MQSSHATGFQSRRPPREAREPRGPSPPHRLDYKQVSRALQLSGDELLLTVARESYGFIELLKRVGSGTQELAPNFLLAVFGVLVKALCPSADGSERASVQSVNYSDASATRNKLVGETIQSLFLQNSINALANKCAFATFVVFTSSMTSNVLWLLIISHFL